MQDDDDKKPVWRSGESRTMRTSRRPEKGKNASSTSRASRPGAESVTSDDQTESGNTSITSLRSRVNSTRRPQKGKNASSTSRASRPGAESVAGIDDQTESVNVSLPSDMESVPEHPKDLDNRPSVADVVNASVTNLVTATVVEDDDAQLLEDMKERERENQLQIQRLMERDAEREKIIHNAAVREAERREQDEELEKSALKTVRKRKFICLGTIAVFLVAVAVVVAVFVTQKPAVQTEYIFIAPTETECQAIADGDASQFNDLSEEVEVTVVFEVIVEDDEDIEELLDVLKEEAQSSLVPYLAGCSDVSRRLGEMEERPAFRGHGRNLNSLDYAVAFGSVGDNVEYESCSDNVDPKCLIIKMQVSLAIKDTIECDALTEDLNSKVSTTPNLLESDDLLMDDFTSIKVSSIEDCEAVAPPEPGPNCCSNNLQDCDASEWCQSRQDRCEGECLGSWIEVGSCTGIELWGDCTNDPSGCCAPAICVFKDEYYSQCKPAEETGEP